METKFIHSGNGCVLTELTSENSACFLASFSLISGILEKVSQVMWKPWCWYPELLRLSKQSSYLISWRANIWKNSTDQIHSLTEDKRKLHSDQLHQKKISEQATTFISTCRRESSLSIYKSLWKKWSSCCIKQNVDPFFVYCFQDGYEYHIIGCIRFVISAFYNHQTPADHHPLVGSLMSPVLNIRLPKPQYSFVWDVKWILQYVKVNWGSNAKLSEEYITYKIAILMALASALNPQINIYFHYIDYINVGERVRLSVSKYFTEFRGDT